MAQSTAMAVVRATNTEGYEVEWEPTWTYQSLIKRIFLQEPAFHEEVEQLLDAALLNSVESAARVVDALIAGIDRRSFVPVLDSLSRQYIAPKQPQLREYGDIIDGTVAPT